MEFSNRKDFMIYLLLELNKKHRPILFGDFFMEVGPSAGIDAFRDILDEMTRMGWVLKKEEVTNEVPVFGYRTIDLRFGISIAGVEYLAKLGLIEDKYQLPKESAFSGVNIGNASGANIILNSPGSSINITNASDKLELVEKIINAVRIDSSIQEQQRFDMAMTLSDLKAEIKRGSVEKSLLMQISTWSDITSIGAFVQQLLIGFGGA